VTVARSDAAVDLLVRRRARYAALLARLNVDVAVLASEAGIAHATGIRLYTMELIPERPVVALLTANETVLVVWEWEHDQLRAQQPGLALVGFPEWGVDPWAVVAGEARRMAGAGGRVLLEGLAPVAAEAPLAATGLSVRQDRDLLLLGVRAPKEPQEIELLRTTARAADESIQAVARERVGGRTERQLAAAIAAGFASTTSGEVEAAGIVSGPGSNRSNHHLAADVPLTAGPVRLGLKARVNGYWVLLTRMAWAGPASTASRVLADDYARYIDAHEAGWRSLTPDVRSGEVYALVRDRLARHDLRLRSPKVGHGTGLTFRELPVLRADDQMPVPEGTILAFDFAIHPESARSGVFVHVEDRILVSPSGPVRLSDAIDTGRPLKLNL
jgi:D-alanyl-D-alanine dipeptidase